MITQSELATERLRELILQGAYPPGAHLQELPLTEALGVSRTPVRSALSTLSKEGLLEYTAKRGYWVRTFSVDEIVDAYEVRATLEGMSCRLVAERGLDERTAGSLHAIVDEMDRILKDAEGDDFDRDRWRVLNSDFHMIILDHANNDLLRRLVGETARIPLATLQTIAYWGKASVIDMVRRSHIDHIYILDALVRRQAFRAEARMREHIQVGGQLVKEQYEAVRDGRAP